jgi:hypothetical protein
VSGGVRPDWPALRNNDHVVRAASHERHGVFAIRNHHIRTGAGAESIVGAKSHELSGGVGDHAKATGNSLAWRCPASSVQRAISRISPGTLGNKRIPNISDPVAIFAPARGKRHDAS